MRVVEKLTWAKKVREEGVVVETPDAVGARGFKEVKVLYSASYSEVFVEDDEDHGLVVWLWEGMQFTQA